MKRQSFAEGMKERLDAETHAQCRADLAAAREQLHRLRNTLQAVITHAATCDDCCGSLAAMGERIAREVGRD